jgi:hypothetical protein
MLKCAGNEDIITMKADDTGDVVTFMFESPGTFPTPPRLPSAPFDVRNALSNPPARPSARPRVDGDARARSRPRDRARLSRRFQTRPVGAVLKNQIRASGGSTSARLDLDARR